eukprot:jgi/Mesen1/695/ME000109S_10908
MAVGRGDSVQQTPGEGSVIAAGSKSVTPSEVDVAIAGGGLGGLALALGLQRIGISAHVFEAAPQLRTDSATIISVGQNGNTALDGLCPSLADDLRENGVLSENARFISREEGQEDATEMSIKLDNMTVVAWRKAQELLAGLVEPAMIHCSHRMSDYRPVQGGVEVVFQVARPAGGGSTTPGSSSGQGREDEQGKEEEEVVVRAKLLVGADGIRSAVRARLLGDRPRFLRCLNWNALVPNPNLSKFGGHGKGEIVHRNDKTAGLQSYLVDAGAGSSFWQVRKMDLDESMSRELGDSWGGLGKPGAKARVLALVAGLPGWQELQAAIEATEESLIFERRIMDRLPADRWSDAGGHVVLLGDAAHAMYPGPGEGARTAFEDAHQLMLALQEVALPSSLEPDAIAAAVHRYEQQRVVRCMRMQGFAAESAGLPQAETMSPEVRALSPTEARLRGREFRMWVTSYPRNPLGDPALKYWKPLADGAVAGAPAPAPEANGMAVVREAVPMAVS